MEAQEPLLHGRHGLHPARNINIGLFWTGVEFASRAIRGGDIMSVLLFTVTQSEVTVGYIQGVNGLAQMLVALPAGIVADRRRRDTSLRLASLLGILACAALVLAVTAFRSSGAWLGAAMAVMGLFSGWTSGPVEALFADSTTLSNRQHLFTVKYQVLTLATAIGPLVGLLGFALLGNEWTPRDCAAVVLCGAALMLPSSLLLWAFSDDATVSSTRPPPAVAAPRTSTPMLLPVSSTPPSPCASLDVAAAVHAKAMHHAARGGAAGAEGGGRDELVPRESGRGPGAGARSECRAPLQESGAERGGGTGAGGGGLEGTALPEDRLREPVRVLPATCDICCGAASHRGAALALADPGGAAGGLLERWWEERVGPWRARRSRVVPGMILASDVLGALASGMTVRFFGLFFYRRCEMRPVMVSLLGVLAPVGVAGLSWASKRMAGGLGPLEVNLLWRAVDIGLLLSMALLPARPGAMSLVLAAVHLVRMAAANCTRPLLRAILMDNVAPKARAMWSAADNIRTFSWSGSAALGGLLISSVGYELTFVVTSAIKLASVVPLLLLLPLTGKRALDEARTPVAV